MVGKSLQQWGWQSVELLWPAACVGCQHPGIWWCGECDAEVVRVRAPTCPTCNQLTVRGESCGRCRKKTVLTGVLVGAHYRHPLPDAIKALKYRHAKQVSPALAGYLLPPLARMPWLPRALLVPVPLHPQRLRTRGHNQSDLLAQTIAKATGLPVAGQLSRLRNTPSQTGLSRQARLDNVREAFIWNGPALAGQIPILVDDVFTTGATLDACAAALRSSGARQVWGLVVAKR